MGGRVTQNNTEASYKEQIIINNSYPIAKLIIKNCHGKNSRIGREQTLNIIRHKFRISSCRRLTRKVLLACLYFNRERAKPQHKFHEWINQRKVANKPGAIFLAGIDSFGPYLVKLSKKKTRTNQANAKRYGVIFTCMKTRTIHLELADISTDSFISPLRRFISPQGNVKHIWSDNGINFTGANKDLHTPVKLIDASHVVAESQNGTLTLPGPFTHQGFFGWEGHGKH